MTSMTSKMFFFKFTRVPRADVFRLRADGPGQGNLSPLKRA